MIDPRTLRHARPRHDRRVGREGQPRGDGRGGLTHGGIGANLAALVQEQACDHLDAPVQRVPAPTPRLPLDQLLDRGHEALRQGEHLPHLLLGEPLGSVIGVLARLLRGGRRTGELGIEVPIFDVGLAK